MKIEVLNDANEVADEAAAIIATDARMAVAARGRFVMAVSGGQTPWVMLRALASKEVPWDGVHVLQVDERVAPAGDPDRNLTHLRESLLQHAPLRPEQIHAMPVESEDLQARCVQLRGDAARGGRLACVAGSGPSRARPRWTYRIAGPGRSGPRRQRCSRRAGGSVPGPAPHDFDLPGAQPRAASPVVGDGERKGADARTPA